MMVMLLQVAVYGRRGHGASDSETEALQGVSPSSTMRDLEAACGPLSAASGSLDAMGVPPAQPFGIFPWLWTRSTLACLRCCEQPQLQLPGLLPPDPFFCLLHAVQWIYPLACPWDLILSWHIYVLSVCIWIWIQLTVCDLSWRVGQAI